MITKQYFPRQTMLCLSSSFALNADVKRLSPFFFGGFLNVSMYFDLQGDQIRFTEELPDACAGGQFQKYRISDASS
jgi:hypothetical protein